MENQTTESREFNVPQTYDFAQHIQRSALDLKPSTINTLQVNITKLCNQACTHCHVDASPRRREMMSDGLIELVIKTLGHHPQLQTLDITGGAPELHPRFQDLVREARALKKKIMVRHNLTVTLDEHPVTGESMHYLPDFFHDNRVEIVSSLPYYQEFFTDKQRGHGVFQKSIESLRILNSKGYGLPDTGLILNLVYNPAGAFLPAPQSDLERDFRKELAKHFDVHFNQLFAITNMPIHRFKAQLIRNAGYQDYMEKLVTAFNPAAAAGIMCRNLISVSMNGTLYDCDFNQMLKMPLQTDAGSMNLGNLEMEALSKRNISVADHCFGCTAGAGSSCGGTTT